MLGGLMSLDDTNASFSGMERASLLLVCIMLLLRVIPSRI